ncbi:NPCBM/NEW2 domain-containing protein [Plebeiibacterium sediminum]|uniref:Alpha-galactosidase n=1 Tax=Plebeiibacterium sediminum TaxID=2992112 RepID=A0AAE3M753_9BACT|nr:NPCBM/NEW2 domain-containing protein [Plebeiobacterium sediminum]MCW3788241.1 NPCBM/NEW2 domain-containing protein [Plebeiobacterium sediminum]
MKILNLNSFVALIFILGACNEKSKSKSTSEELIGFKQWAATPPMGWNSWDCFGPSVVEDEVKANADYMAEHLKEFGWEYIVVDIRWFADNQTTGHYNPYDETDFIIDEFGRYMPSPKRFPSAANGAGFKPLADYIHDKGLKFGIHIMRGVPKEAVFNKMPIKGTNVTADQIYSTEYECTWLKDNYTIVKGKEGSQEYYNSILDLYASWGVDYIKVDDLSRPYHTDEIEMIRKAIDQCGRPIVFSMSPGATPIDQHEHAKNNANLWRTIDDFWDNWAQLNYSFTMCAKWAPYITKGAWPDADMLPLGKFIRGERATDRYTNFTKDEQYSLMTLWSMFKSPLMFGGNLPDNDEFTNEIITNKEVLYVNQHSENNKELYSKDGMTVWTAEDPANGDMFVALFNNEGDGFVKTKDLLYRSGTVSHLTDGFGENIDVKLPEGTTELYLIVNDGGDGHSWDHADWINPEIELSTGKKIKLTDLKWEYATAGWGKVSINKSVSGKELNVKGTVYKNGIGTHSKSIIMYQIPDNSVRFTAFAGLDKAATDVKGGTTVEFMLATQDPTPRNVDIKKALVNTGRISRRIAPKGKELEADITGADKLYLVVTDAGDKFNNDHADWINPTLYNDKGETLSLTDLEWTSADSGWGKVQKNKSVAGKTLTVAGKTYQTGIGTHSNSVIVYDIPEGYTKFKALCGYDDEVKDAADGVTMEFLVYTENPVLNNSKSIPIHLKELGFEGECTIRDLWNHEDLGTVSAEEFATTIPTHGAGLYRISGTRK